MSVNAEETEPVHTAYHDASETALLAGAATAYSAPEPLPPPPPSSTGCEAEAEAAAQRHMRSSRFRTIGNAVTYLASGTYLPMFTDKVRNNVRSRAVLIAVYSLSTALVALLLVLMFSLKQSSTWSVSFGTSPATVAYIGQPFDPFSFVIRNAQNEGVKDELVSAILMPLNEFNISLTTTEGTAMSRSILCLLALAQPSSGTFQEDQAYCDPNGLGLMVSTKAVTDHSGTALFSDLTLGYGVPGNYVLVVMVVSQMASLYLTQYVLMKSNVLSVEVLHNGLAELNGDALGWVPIVTAASYPAGTFDVTVRVTWSPPPPTIASITRKILTSQTFANVTGLDFTSTRGPELPPDQVPGYVCGSVVLTRPQKNSYATLNNIPQPLTGTPRKAGTILNPTACNSTVVVKNMTRTTAIGRILETFMSFEKRFSPDEDGGSSSASSSGGGDSSPSSIAEQVLNSFVSKLDVFQVYETELTFQTVGLTSTNTPLVFFGVSAMGLTVPLVGLSTTTPVQSPHEILIGSSPLPSIIPVVTVSSLPPLGPLPPDLPPEFVDFVVVEGRPFGGLSVNVKSAAGAPLPNRGVYLYTRASPLNKEVIGVEAYLSPVISSKQLFELAAVTDANGNAVFSSAFFSVTGAPGLYEMYAVCDGVDAVWPMAKNASQGAYVVVQVVTSVEVVDMTFVGGAATQPEYVGESWKVLPLFLVKDGDGNPIPGKVVTVVPLSMPENTPTTSASIPSSNQGISLLISATVWSIAQAASSTPASWESSVIPSAPVEIEFAVLVDHVVFGVFTCLILPFPRAVTNPASFYFVNTSTAGEGETDYVLHGDCAFVRIRPQTGGAPNFRPTFGVPADVILDAIDMFGRPVPYANITVTIGPQYMPVPPGMSIYAVTTTAFANGSAIIQSNIDGLSSTEYPLVVDAQCAPNAQQNTPVWKQYYKLNNLTVPGSKASSSSSSTSLSTISNANHLSTVFVSRVRAVNMLSAGAGVVTLQLDVPDWSLVSETDPINVTLTAVWYPTYTVNFLNAADFPQATYALVSNATMAASFNLTLKSDILAMPVGLYGFAVMVDGNTMNPFFVSDMSFPNVQTIQLRIVQSLLEGLTTLPVSEILPTQPIIEVLWSPTGNLSEMVPLPNKKVFLQMGIILPDGTRQYQDVYQNASLIALGGFSRAALAPDGSLIGLNKPISAPSDVNGYANFSNLFFAAGVSQFNYTVRYCVSLDVAMALGELNDTYSSCVEDPNIVTILYEQNVNYVFTTVALSGSPGQPLPDISVTGRFNNGRGLLGTMCTPQLFNAPPDYLVFQANIFSRYQAYGTFVTLGSTLTVSNQITLSSSIPTGTYLLYFVCAGGISNQVPLVVSMIPTKITFLVPPPPTITLSQLVPVSVKVTSVASIPVASVDVQLVVSSAAVITPPQNTTFTEGWSKEERKLSYQCSGFVCGIIDGVSQLFATTDVNGIALFYVVLDTAISSDLDFTVSVASQLSTAGTRQAALSQLTAVSRALGVPTSRAQKIISAMNPTYAGVFAIAANLAASGQQSGTGTYVQPSESSAAAQESQFTSEDAVADSFLSKMFADALSSVTATIGGAAGLQLADPLRASVRLVNPVAYGETIIPPALPERVTLPLSVENAVVESATQPPVQFQINHGPGCPLYRFLDVDGQPVANIQVVGEIVPYSNSVIVEAPNGTFLTNATGYVWVCPFTVTATTTGTFRIRLSAAGAGPILTSEFTVDPPPQISRLEYMKYLAGFLVVFFSPMLVASVPHTYRAWGIFAFLVSLATTLLGDYLKSKFVPDEPLYNGYFVFIEVLAALVTVTVFCVAVIDFFGYILGFYWLRFVNDERKALQTIRYCRWILNVRERHQTYYREQLAAEAAKQAPKRSIMDRLEKIATRGMRKINETSNTDVFDTTAEENDRKHRKMRKANSRALLFAGKKWELIYNRADLDPVYTPINFLIVVAIAVVLLVTLCFVILYFYQYLLSKINEFVSYLPDTSGTMRIKLLIANKALVFGVSAAIEVVVAAFPSMSKLSALIPSIQKINLIDLLSSLHELIAAGLVRLQVSFWVGGSVATVGFLATIALTWIEIPPIIRGIRRGQLQIPSSIPPMEGYIGMHCLQLVIFHQLLFWPVVLVSFLASIEMIRVFVWDKLQVIIVASVVSYITQFLMQAVLVGWFLSTGAFTVIRPEFYSIWHFAGLILGIFTGLMKSVVRWALSLGLVTALFARLDQAIYPKLFGSMDKAHSGFMCVVAVEAKNGNPLYLLFSTLLLLPKELHRVAQGSKQGPGERLLLLEGGGGGVAETMDAQKRLLLLEGGGGGVAETMDAQKPNRNGSSSRGWLFLDDQLWYNNTDLAANVKNMARILLRMFANSASLDLRTPPSGYQPSSSQQQREQGGRGDEYATDASHSSFLKTLSVSLHPASRSLSSGTEEHETAGQGTFCSRLFARATNQMPTSVAKAPPGMFFNMKPYLGVTMRERQRREKVRQRWWLFVMLTLNPSLKFGRKRYLFSQQKVEESEANNVELFEMV